MRTLTRHRRTSMFFEIRVLWGDARFFALFAYGCLSWLLLGGILASAGAVFAPPRGGFCVPRDYILSPSCRSGVSLRQQEPIHCNSKKKHEATLELIWEPFGTHFETIASQNRADKGVIAILCQSFFESVSRSVPKRLFRGNC